MKVDSALQKYIKIDYNQILLKASKDGDLEAVTELLNNYRSEIDLEFKNGDGNTALILACCQGYEEITKKLIEAGSNVDVKTKYESTALMCASKNNNTAVVELLLKTDCDKNIKNKYGYTALILASEQGHKEIVEMLLKAGCDKDIQNEYRNTALMCASKNNHTAIIELLSQKSREEIVTQLIKEIQEKLDQLNKLV